MRSKEDFDIAGPMKTRNIDTGAGLERIALLMQGVDNMYETDEVFPVIERAAAMAGKRYGADHTDDVRLRVVGDHVRSSLMLMTDGVTPGNEARGYVLRRLMRRTIRSMRLLGVEKVSLTELLDVSRQCMHATYPEIDDQWERIKDIADNESESFERTLNSGTQLFDMAVAEARAAGSNELGGDKAFQLHDTYGFPIDLTLEMASEQGLHVDETAFRTLMDQQKARAKADAKAKKGNLQDAESYRELRDRGETPFVGYSELTVPTRVRGLVADGHVVDHLRAGKLGEVVLEETPSTPRWAVRMPMLACCGRTRANSRSSTSNVRSPASWCTPCAPAASCAPVMRCRRWLTQCTARVHARPTRQRTSSMRRCANWWDPRPPRPGRTTSPATCASISIPPMACRRP